MKWKDRLVKKIILNLENDNSWRSTYNKLVSDKDEIGVHLAIFSEPYMTLIFDGIKTIESRFSINKVSPFGRIGKGDLVVIKKTGGPITGFFIAGKVEYFHNLNSTKVEEIEAKYGDKIGTCYDPSFWESRERAKYATLISIDKIKKVSPFTIEKNDRTAWVVLKTKSYTMFQN